MEEKFNKTPAKSNRWFRAFVVIALLYGITFSLDSFFNWIFFFAAAYSLFMSYFTLPVQPRVFQGNQNRSRQYSADDTETVNPQDRAKRIAIIIASSIVGLFVFLLVIGLLVGNDPDEFPEEQSYDMNSNPDALVSRGNEYYNAQQYDSAEIYYNMALDLDETSAGAVYGKAIIYDQRGETISAIEYYKKSVGLDSTYVNSYGRLAELDPENQEMYLKLVQKYSGN